MGTYTPRRRVFNEIRTSELANRRAKGPSQALSDGAGFSESDGADVTHLTVETRRLRSEPLSVSAIGMLQQYSGGATVH